MKYSIGVDIGGTKVAIAIVNEHGIVKTVNVIPTNVTISPEKMIEIICNEIVKVINQSKVDENKIIGIGIGAPGPLDSRNGMIMCPPNLTGWIDIPIQKIIQESFSFPVTLENDANAAALAEKWVGAAKDSDNFTYMTVSTGIGSGIVVEGKLLRGLKGNA